VSSPRVSWNLRIPLIGVTGSITGTDLTKPAFPAVVSIGGVNAMVEYVGSAPDAVTGLLQVNALVPLNAPTGPAVGISLTIGTAQSPAGVTVAVE